MTAVRVATACPCRLHPDGLCGRTRFPYGSSAAAPAPIDASMTGRWILAAPNSPSCGLNFGGAAGARNGAVSPDGGCPGGFFMSRRWAMEGSVLTIADDENQPLAQLRLGGDRFEGQINQRHSCHSGTLDQRGSHGRISALLLRAIRQCLPRRADAQSDRRRLGAGLGRFLQCHAFSARRNFATTSTKWAKRRCSCTARKSSRSRA